MGECWFQMFQSIFTYVQKLKCKGFFYVPCLTKLKNTVEYAFRNNFFPSISKNKVVNSQIFISLSFNPKHTTRPVFHSQGLCYNCTCSDSTDWAVHLREIEQCFLHLQYNLKAIAIQISRTSLGPAPVCYNTNPVIITVESRFQITYSLYREDLRHIIKDVQTLLQNDDCLEVALEGKPIMAICQTRAAFLQQQPMYVWAKQH